jgi:hypothetical protein
MLRRRLFPTAGPACGVVQLVQRHVQRGKHELVLSLSSPTWCVALLSSMRRESVAQRRAVRVRWGHDDDEHSASLNRFRDGMPVQFAYCLLVPGATTCMHACCKTCARICLQCSRSRSYTRIVISTDLEQ